MAAINFRTKSKHKQEATIYVTFRNGRDCALEIKSGITAPFSDWLIKGRVVFKKNDPQQYVKQNLQLKLDELRATISRSLLDQKKPSKEWLQGCVNEFHGVTPITEDYLIDFFDKYIDYVTNHVANVRSPHTVKTYYTSKSRIAEYQSFTGQKYRIQDIDLEFKGQFIQWSRTIAKYQSSTYMKTIKQIKTVVKFAKRNQIVVNESFLDDTETMEVHTRKKNSLPVLFLTTLEIEKLMGFKGKQILETARDWLIISCWTGCRVSDLMKLTSKNIHTTISGEKAIKYTQQKTGDKITAPFHPNVAEIIEAHAGEFPTPIKPQKYNDCIKEVCRLVGMNEMILGEKRNPKTNRKERDLFPKYDLVTSHIGRRSFASNHYGQIPTEIIMLVTGHDTVRQFLDYVGKDPEEHVALMHQLYNQNAHSLRSNTEATL